MALSNIFREPQREITESVVGIAFCSIVVFGVGSFAVWFAHRTADANNPFGAMVIVGVLSLVVGGLIFFGLAHLTHAIGDGLCNWLDKKGLQLRPKERAETRELRAQAIKQYGLEKAKTYYPQLFKEV